MSSSIPYLRFLSALRCADHSDNSLNPAHHPSAFRQVFRVIVGSPHFVLFSVGELPLYPGPGYNRARWAAWTRWSEKHARSFRTPSSPWPERIEHGRIGNGPYLRANGGEKVCSFPGIFLKFSKNGYCLFGQGNKMMTAHFHAFGRDGHSPDSRSNSFH